jgi:hypothetical protein
MSEPTMTESEFAKMTGHLLRVRMVDGKEYALRMISYAWMRSNDKPDRFLVPFDVIARIVPDPPPSEGER